MRFVNADIIDGTGAAPIRNGVLEITPDGRIGFVGTAAEAPPLVVGTEVRDLCGKTLLPGFIDCHVHLGFSLADGPFHVVQSDPALVVLESAARIRATLDAGVTTARDLGGLTLGFREAIERGLIPGPRLQLAVRPISHTAGHGDMHLHGGHVVHTLPGMMELADTVDEVRKATRRVLRDGADLVKICTTGGMGSRHDQPDDEGLRLDEVRAIVDELDRHGGKPVAAHAQGRKGILTALRGGVTSVEHGYGIDDEGLDLLGERGTFLVPTLSTVFAIDQATMQPYHYAKKVKWSEITKENIGNAIARGARIALGTDAGVCPHGENLRELDHLVQLGMSPMAAIVAGTRTGAELLGIADQVGTLRPGLIADLVATDADPLLEIKALGDPARIQLVVSGGAVVKDLT
ncbi:MULTISPECIES: metal-dependent hydrolase family protein [unclassified Kribbella]|uniref:metal-dependent hydrolase family protein n=1 Tax=unclassified Kribbella TaxID=2644121 RepID=UPI00307690F1